MLSHYFLYFPLRNDNNYYYVSEQTNTENAKLFLNLILC